MKVASPKHSRIEATQRRVQLLDDGSGDENEETARIIASIAPSSQASARPKAPVKKTSSSMVTSPKSTPSTQSPPLKKTLSKENGAERQIKSPPKEPAATQLQKATPKVVLNKAASSVKKSPPKAKSTPSKSTPASMDVDKFDYTIEPTRYVPPPEKVEKQRKPLPMPVLMTPEPVKPAAAPALSPPVPVSQPKKEVAPVNKSALLFNTEPFFSEKEPSSPRPRILFALTGSVATIKLNDLLHLLTKNNDVIVVTTKSAEHFATTEKFEDVRFYNDQSEYAMWKERNDPVLHIELRKWADLFVIAPLSANTLAKLANGLCDNLVTCIARAWDFERPFYVAPAMNTLMWTHPFTSKHLSILEDLGIKVIEPIQKTLMCGDKGTC